MSRGNIFRRSLDALRNNRHNLTFDPEHYSEVLPMMTVPTEESIYQQCALGSDSDTGGYSTATLTYHQENGMPFMRFKGNLSLHVPPDSRKKGMTHSGWAGWRTKPMGATLFNRNPVWAVGLFRFLSLRVRGDDRRYYINVQTESLDPVELWQHRLFLQSPGQWETVLIPWSDFLRTRNGRITHLNPYAMNRDEIKTVGASLIERKEGPFCLDIAEIKAVNPHGFHGPYTRYTKKDMESFQEAELRRNAEEQAAYFAWKRGDFPIGTPPPKYTPPNPDAYCPPIAKPTGNTSAPLHERDPSEYDSQPDPVPRPKRLFDDLLDHERAEREHRENPDAPQTSRRKSLWTEEEKRIMFDEDPDLLREREEKREKVDIDSVDVTDYSIAGTKRRMRAMADELEGFSSEVMDEVERVEELRAEESRRRGREIRDLYGMRFEDVSKGGKKKER